MGGPGTPISYSRQRIQDWISTISYSESNTDFAGVTLYEAEDSVTEEEDDMANSDLESLRRLREEMGSRCLACDAGHHSQSLFPGNTAPHTSPKSKHSPQPICVPAVMIL